MSKRIMFSCEALMKDGTIVEFTAPGGGSKFFISKTKAKQFFHKHMPKSFRYDIHSYSDYKLRITPVYRFD